MRYVLPEDGINRLKSLRNDYEKKTGVNLAQSPSFFKLPTVVGGKDIEKRKAQIAFIEKFLCLLDSKFVDKNDIETVEQYISKLTASRVMLAVCLYIRQQISATYTIGSEDNSVLYSLIDQALAMYGLNTMDDDDKMSCYMAAANLLNISEAFAYANQVLVKNQMDPFGEKEWEAFKEYLTQNTNKDANDYDFINWPITSLTKPFFGYVGSSLGATAGYLSGHILSTSSLLTPTSNSVTNGVANGILIFGLGSTLGASFVAPLVATKALGAFLEIFFAQSLHFVMRKVGEAAGVSIGLPIDLVYQHLSHTLQNIWEQYRYEPITFSGIRIADGKMFTQGKLMNSELEEAAKQARQNKVITIDPDGSFRAKDGQVANLKEIMDQVTAEFKEKLAREHLAELPNHDDNATSEASESFAPA